MKAEEITLDSGGFIMLETKSRKELYAYLIQHFGEVLADRIMKNVKCGIQLTWRVAGQDWKLSIVQEAHHPIGKISVML